MTIGDWFLLYLVVCVFLSSVFVYLRCCSVPADLDEHDSAIWRNEQ